MSWFSAFNPLAWFADWFQQEDAGGPTIIYAELHVTGTSSVSFNGQLLPGPETPPVSSFTLSGGGRGRSKKRRSFFKSLKFWDKEEPEVIQAKLAIKCNESTVSFKALSYATISLKTVKAASSVKIKAVSVHLIKIKPTAVNYLKVDRTKIGWELISYIPANDYAEEEEEFLEVLSFIS